MQRLFRALLCTFIAQNALGGVLALSRFTVYLYIHRADLKAFAAADAFILIAMNTQQRKIAHGL